MNVFEIRDRLVRDFADYARSFVVIRDERIRERVDAELEAGLLWPDPIVQLNPAFEPGETIDEAEAACGAAHRLPAREVALAFPRAEALHTYAHGAPPGFVVFDLPELFRGALDKVERCECGEETSCYNCLCSYTN